MRVRSGKRFRQIYIEVTNVCNLSCSFCPGTVRESGFMQRDIFERCVKEAAPLADQVYLHVMGEPLLHPEIGQCISFCGSAGLPVAVTTNGTFDRHRRATQCLNPHTATRRNREPIFEARTRRDGRALEYLGYYNPMVDPAEIKVDSAKVRSWLEQGAKPSDTVRALLQKAGV